MNVAFHKTLVGSALTSPPSLPPPISIECPWTLCLSTLFDDDVRRPWLRRRCQARDSVELSLASHIRPLHLRESHPPAAPFSAPRDEHLHARSGTQAGTVSAREEQEQRREETHRYGSVALGARLPSTVSSSFTCAEWLDVRRRAQYRRRTRTAPGS